MSTPNFKTSDNADNEAVDVLLVTVTKIEARAVLALTESQYGCVPTQFYNQKTYYDLGKIGGARVAMVRSEMGAGGTAGSQATITAAIRDLSPSSIIMVGIAFGVHQEKQEIGEVLVSQHIQEYDLQKIETQNQDVHIIPRGERIQSATKLLDRFRDGELYWRDSEVTFGLLLSGSKLIDNLNFRDKLLDIWPEAIGGEMEGFGVYTAASISKTDWIIVKGICDWADGNKKDDKTQRQQLAAKNAAAFAMFVISRGGLARSSPLPELNYSELDQVKVQSAQPEIIDKPISKKSVIIAYADEDTLQALNLSEEIEKSLNKSSVDIEFFELNSNFQLKNYISLNNHTDKWFLFLMSKNSINSYWFKLELRSETLLDLEQRKYHIVIAQLDNTSFPDTVESILQERRKISLQDNNDKIIDLLQSNTNTRADKIEFFVNRGHELDQLELAITRSRIIYLTGVPGIGKASLLRAAVRSRFHRDLIQINLSPGHDLELLAREAIAETGNVQPSELFSDNELMKISVNKVLERVAQGGVLFINNAQHAMTTEGSLRKYLQGFINALVAQEIAFPIIISSTRRTEISPEEAKYIDIIRIDRLSDEFMNLIVRHWITSSNQMLSSYSDSDLKTLVEQLEGFPLAARMIIGYLMFENPKRLAQVRFISRFQRKVAEYIVSNILSQLNDLDQTILQALAIFSSGMSTRQLLTIKSIAGKGTENVQDSIEKLMSLMLINQSVDVIELQPLLISYFSDKALHQNTYETLALELADFSWKEVKRISEDMAVIPKKDRNAGNKDYLRLSKKLLKIAEPAHRLLLTTRQNTKANQIPFRLRGHLREMVLVMYQQAKDYKACAEFAQEWLKIDPTDSEILLYQARAFRQLRDYHKATEILDKLERQPSKLLKSKVFRERGMISDAQGNMEEAIHFFRNGRIKRWDGRLYYPQINANLAVLLMAEADQRTGNSKDRSKRYAEAVELLSEAREFIPLFEENYLDLYINAQLRSGDISEQRALDIINEALALQADNSKLYFRAAEILADLQRLDEALVYAEEARIRGDKRSILTMVNIFLTKSQFQDALDLLATLTPESPREQMISDVLRARALKHNPKYARELLQPYEDLRNSFVIYARIQIELNAAENEQGTARQECIAVAEQILRENQQFYDRKLFKPLVEQMQRLQNLGSPT